MGLRLELECATILFLLDNVENIQMNQSGGYKYKDGTPVEEEFDGYATAETRPGGVEKSVNGNFFSRRIRGVAEVTQMPSW